MTITKERLEALLAGVLRSGSSSLHLCSGSAPWIRLTGRVVATGDEVLSAGDLEELAAELLFAEQIAALGRGGEIDVVWNAATGERFRLCGSRHEEGHSFVFRHVPKRTPDLRECELPESLAGFAAIESGLIVVAGPPASGKSVTVAAVLERLLRERPAHVMTLDRRIEFHQTSSTAWIHQREIGTHVESIAAGVRDAFASGVDVLAVGSVESIEDLRAVLDATEGGLLVIAAYEASSVVGAIAELSRMAPVDDRLDVRERLATSLRVVVGQSLVRRRNGLGRVPLLEVLVSNDAVARAIRRGRPESLHRLMANGAGLGMQTADMALSDLLRRNLISEEEATQHARESVRSDASAGRSPALRRR